MNARTATGSSAVRHFVAAMMIVALATPACAQVSPNLAGGSTKLKTDVDIKQEQDRENGFKSGINKIPDAKGKVDPWGNVRGAATPPAAQSQARPSSK
jgi:hypothetical protein